MSVNTNNDVRWEQDDAQYLRDLSRRLMGVPVCHGVDQYDAERTYNLAKQVVKPKRKVIQIAASDSAPLLALCDDGTVWSVSETEGWKQLLPVPQDD